MAHDFSKKSTLDSNKVHLRIAKSAHPQIRYSGLKATQSPNLGMPLVTIAFDLWRQSLQITQKQYHYLIRLITLVNDGFVVNELVWVVFGRLAASKDFISLRLSCHSWAIRVSSSLQWCLPFAIKNSIVIAIKLLSLY